MKSARIMIRATTTASIRSLFERLEIIRLFFYVNTYFYCWR